MKKVAALILNRNLPHLADELGAWMLHDAGELVDLYGIENGSDPEKRSRFAKIIFSTSLGPAGGINAALRELMPRGYEYFWINYNDARYQQSGFVQAAVELLDHDPQIAMVVPFWEGNTWVYGHYHGLDLVTYFSVLGFVVRRRALDVIANHPRFHLEPLWDSSNFSNHDNILATLLALYERGFYTVADRRHHVSELQEPADTSSLAARGYSAEQWKHQKGPADLEAWYARTFPQLTGTYKTKRQYVIHAIEHRIVRTISGAVSVWRRALHYGLWYLSRRGGWRKGLAR